MWLLFAQKRAYLAKQYGFHWLKHIQIYKVQKSDLFNVSTGVDRVDLEEEEKPKRQGWTTKILLAAQVNYLTTKELKPLLPWTAHHLDLELLEQPH